MGLFCLQKLGTAYVKIILFDNLIYIVTLLFPPYVSAHDLHQWK